MPLPSSPSSSVLRHASRSILRPRLRPLPLLRHQRYSQPARDPAELDHLTRLPNGIRVATEALPGHFSGVGVFIDAGSRYEPPRFSGVSHIADRLAFKSTSTRSASSMLEAMESLGGSIQCASSRESLMYQAAIFNKDVASMTGLFAETIRDPLITDEEVAQQLETADYEISEIWSKPELILPEMVHTVAFEDNTLGKPLLCPMERLEEIDRYTVLQYRDVFYRPDKFVVAFAGVDHGTAVRLGEQYFGDMKAAGPIPDDINLDEPAKYTGGIQILEPSDVPTHLPQFTHLHIAFEGLSIDDPDIYALATLQTLLGGGGSFSAGGPGKGMYSRLYTRVLNQHSWIESSIAFNSGYTDSGLIGISASCMPEASYGLMDVLLNELADTFSSGRNRLQKDEVERAKNQLRSALLMNLESRMVELEDLGRQVQAHGKKIGAMEMSAKIAALTVEDVKRVAERVLTGRVENRGGGSGKATIVIQGTRDDVERMGDLEAKVKKYGLGR